MQDDEFDEILDQLKREYIESTIERLDSIELILDRNAIQENSRPEGLADIRREAHTIKGMGVTFGFPLLSSVAHRLEDYLSNLTKLSVSQIRDCNHYTDVMREIVTSGENLGNTQLQAKARELPSSFSSSLDVQSYKAEILIGVNSGVMRNALNEELSTQGFRIMKASSAFDILQFAVTVRPNAVIVDGIMSELEGADIARALGAMEATKHIPVGILTSLADADLGGLPEEVTVIHKDADHFVEGLAQLVGLIKVGE